MKVAILVLVSVAAVAYAQQQQMQAPPFLQGAPVKIIAEFSELLTKAPDKSEDELDNDVELWISKQNPKIKVAYEQFKRQMEQMKAQAEAAHKAAVAKLSPAAQKADAEITAIITNPKLKGREKQEKVEAVLSSVPPAIRKELEQPQ